MGLRDELESIREANEESVLQPDEIVEWAKKNKSSDLYRQFEWDDAVAGHEYRISQARRIIKITFVNEEGKPEMISLSQDRIRKGGGYRTMESVMSHAQMRSLALADALADLERVKERYEYLQELAGVWEAARNVKVKSSGRGRRKGGEARPSA